MFNIIVKKKYVWNISIPTLSSNGVFYLYYYLVVAYLHDKIKISTWLPLISTWMLERVVSVYQILRFLKYIILIIKICQFILK